MFDLFVTILHVLLISGIVLAVMTLRRFNGGEKDDRGHGVISGGKPNRPRSEYKNNPNVIILLCLLFGDPFNLHSEIFDGIPDYQNGKLIWEGENESAGWKLYSYPKRPMALIEQKYLLEFPAGTVVEPPDNGLHIDVYPEKGSEAYLAISPFRMAGYHLKPNLIMWKSNIRTPGNYSLRLGAVSLPGGEQIPALDITIYPYRYLSFGREFSLFVIGCLGVAAGYFLVTHILSRLRSCGDEKPLHHQVQLK